MRLEFTTQAAAQTCANAIHSRQIAANPGYARSVQAGLTQRWAAPYRDLDRNRQPVGNWWVNVKPRVEPVLMPAERVALKPYG